MAAGAWVALAGAAVAVFGSAQLLPETSDVSEQRFCWAPALAGASLAVVGPLLLPWVGLAQGSVLEQGYRPFEIWADGLDTDLITGYPILILGAAVLLFAALAGARGGPTGERRGLLVACQASGTAIAVLAGMEIASTLMNGDTSTSQWLVLSGPLTALAGGIMLARATQPAKGEEGA